MSFHLSNEVVKSIKAQSFMPEYVKVQKQLNNFKFGPKTSSVSKKITNYKDTILSEFWLAVSSIALSAATLIVSFLSLLIQLYS